jgi:hypothetical protein
MMNPPTADAGTHTGLAPEDLPHVPPEVKDMDDALEIAQEWPQCPQLLAAIRHCQEHLKPVYDTADLAAAELQKKHKRITFWAAVAGAFAIVFAILELTPLEQRFQLEPSVLALFEVFAALAAGIAVRWGLRAAFHPNWLLARYRAERLRLLKFAALREPILLEANGAQFGAWQQWLDGQINEVLALTKEQMKQWGSTEPSIEVPRKWQSLCVPDGDLLDLVKYFQLKRIGVQFNFFTRRAAEHEKLNRRTSSLPRLFFFASVGAALLRFAFALIEFVANELFKFHFSAAWPFVNLSAWLARHEHLATLWQVLSEKPHWWELLLLAAALPVGGAALRTVRSASEYARHEIRYGAKRVGLAYHAKILAGEAQKLKPATNQPVPTPDAERVMLELWGAEQIIEAEHREWLRLMLEAEWFG